MQVGEVLRRVAERLVLPAQADCGKERVHAALERVEVGRPAGAGPGLGLQRPREDDTDGLRLARQHGARLRRVLGRRDRLVPQVDLADLEQAGRVVEPVDVVLDRLEQPGKQHGAHHGLVDAHGVGEPDRVEPHVALRKAERIQRFRGDEGVGEDLVQAAAGQGAAHGAPHALLLGEGAGRGVSRQRLRRRAVPGDAPDLLDEVDLSDEVGAERGRRDGPYVGGVRVAGRHGGAVLLHAALEPAQDAGLLGGGDLVAEQGVRLAGPEAQRRRRRGNAAGVDHARRDGAAAQLGEHPAGEVEGARHEVRVDALLEPVAGLAADAGVQLGAQDARAGEVGRLEHEVGGALVDLGVLAAEHAGDDERPLDVGDHQHLVVQRALHAVEGDDLLAGRGAARDELAAADLAGVERVQRLAVARASRSWSRRRRC